MHAWQGGWKGAIPSERAFVYLPQTCSIRVAVGQHQAQSGAIRRGLFAIRLHQAQSDEGSSQSGSIRRNQTRVRRNQAQSGAISADHQRPSVAIRSHPRPSSQDPRGRAHDGAVGEPRGQTEGSDQVCDKASAARVSATPLQISAYVVFLSRHSGALNANRWPSTLRSVPAGTGVRHRCVAAT